MGDLSYRREVILEDCRWLFGQDVRIVTLTATGGANHALVLPKAYSLRSLFHGDINEKILFHAQSRGTLAPSDSAIRTLFDMIKERISQIFKFDSNVGLYHIDKSKIPAEVPIVPAIPDRIQLNVIEVEDHRGEALVQDVELVDPIELERQGDVSQAQHDTIDRLSPVSTNDLINPPSNTEPNSGELRRLHLGVDMKTFLGESKRNTTTEESTVAQTTDSQQLNATIEVPETDPYEIEHPPPQLTSPQVFPQGAAQLHQPWGRKTSWRLLRREVDNE